ncbi:MAG: glycosyltransferase [Nanoarchaeota archaeon]
MTLKKFMEPKILVGCTVADVKRYCLGNYVAGLRRLTYKNFDVVLIDNSKTDKYAKEIAKFGYNVIKTIHHDNMGESITEGMNMLRDIALKDYDYFICLEQDVVPPPNLIELMLETKKDIVTGVVPHLLLKPDGSSRNIALLGIDDIQNPGKYKYFDLESVMQNKEGLVKSDYCSMSCLMMSKNALKKIKFRYEPSKNNEMKTIWYDFCFSKDAKKNKFEIYANLAIKCQHYFFNGWCVTLGNTKGGEFVKKEKVKN